VRKYAQTVDSPSVKTLTKNIYLLFIFLSTGSFFQTLGKFNQNASQKESVGQEYLEMDFGEIER
jgi:hypothetical protein